MLGMDMGLSLTPKVTPVVSAGGGALAAMAWSPTDKTTNISVSGGGLIAASTSGAGFDTVRATRAVGFDKTYWEVTVDHAQNCIAVADSAAVLPTPTSAGAYWGLTSFGQAGSAHAAIWNGNAGQVCYNEAFTGVANFTAADVISVALDRVAKIVWFRKNGGSWIMSGDPVAGTGGQALTSINSDIFPAAEVGSEVGFVHSQTANFGTTPGGTAGFAFTPPTGFVAP
jgi:hypothetical protein